MLLGVIFWVAVLAVIVYYISEVSTNLDVAKAMGNTHNMIKNKMVLILLLLLLPITYLQIFASVVSLTFN